MPKSIVRTDKWLLNPSKESLEYGVLTIQKYREFCKALSYIVLARWTEINASDSRCQAIERLIHQTSKNPNPKHSYFGKQFYKFPSYLRRAAIEFVCGQVSSYMTRYRVWQGGDRKHRKAKPPIFNSESGCYPALYKGQCIKFDETFSTASIKVWNGSDWVWSDMPIVKVRSRHLRGKILSPSLIIRNGKAHLSMPVKLKPKQLEEGPVCSVDVGINTFATCSIVYSDGTVIARKFIHPGIDIDRRDRQIKRVQVAARKTKKLDKGFCSTQYRKARQYNRNIAQQASRQVINFAMEYGANVIVLEDLKGWKPKAGRKRSRLKQKFHGWLHRAFADLVEEKFSECGGSVVYVYPRGTSAWAFDGSGRVKRDKKQYELATFKNGKQFSADLNAAHNIAARYWDYKLKLTRRNHEQACRGKSSSHASRMPIVLSDLWSATNSSVGQEAPPESKAS